jgi:hypothetical protein
MKMGLLRSVKDVPNIDYYEYKENNYYNNYRYRAKFRVDGLSYTSYVKTPEALISRLNETGYRRISPGNKALVMEKINELNNFINWRNTNKKPGSVTFRLEGNTASIYSNNLDLLLTLKDLGLVTVKITEVQIEQFAGTKYYVNKPKHNYRIYLKSAYIEDKNFIKDLYDTVKKSKELVPSNALRDWLDEYVRRPIASHNSWSYRYTSGTHSIDYDNESTLSYLMLMYGHMLGKRYKLEKRLDPI